MWNILEKEGRKKLKFGEVGLHVCENFWEKFEQKNFLPECS